MNPIKASRTEANLREAFAAEILASRRYLAFAERAENEGMARAAALFRTVAASRDGRARKHLEFLESAVSRTGSSTVYDLRLAIMHEVHECSDLYPAMIRHARDEGLEDVADWLETVAKASRSHAGRFRRALSGLL